MRENTKISKCGVGFAETKKELALLLKSMRLMMKSADNADAVLDEFSSQGIDLTERQIRQFYHEHGVRMSRRQSLAVKQYARAMKTIGGREEFLRVFRRWLHILAGLVNEFDRLENCQSKKIKFHIGSKKNLSVRRRIIRGVSDE